MGTGAAALLIGARGREAWAATQSATSAFVPSATSDLLLSSNENPLGPGKHVLEAMQGILGESGAGAGRYFFAQQAKMREVLGSAHGARESNVVVGAGSSEILLIAADLFTTPDRGVVTPDPTFGTCAGRAALLGHPVERIGLDAALRVDLQRMVSAAKGAGLVYLCNPNNPTATAWSGPDMRAAILEMLKISPETTILVDEAYYEYATDPSYATMIPLALENPRVIVARTFSKAYGMAGLRLGYGVSHEDTIKKMSDWRGMDMFTSVPGRVGAVAALGNKPHLAKEIERNEVVRRATRKFFHDAGYEDTDSQANFVYIDIRSSNEDFKKACRERGVRIGGGSKLYPKRARISLGTMEEMERAFGVFEDALKEVKQELEALLEQTHAPGE
jgi:histidinol-phosphate aminotransferase